MSLNYIVAGDYGQIIILTVLDSDTNAAADISTYDTSIQLQFRDPGRKKELKNAVFVSDGTDGKIKYTLTTGDIDEAGSWAVRAIVQSGTAKLSTEWAPFSVLD